MMPPLQTHQTVLVIGASSAIAKAYIALVLARHENACDIGNDTKPLQLLTVSRADVLQIPLNGQVLPSKFIHQHFCCDYSERGIEDCAEKIAAIHGEISRSLICNGVLHSLAEQQDADPMTPNTGRLMPEKRIEDIDAKALQQLFYSNSLVPMLWLKALTPLLPKQPKLGHHTAVITVLSARVGSISDNRLGGWYGYRASKAALNMLLKTTAIEYARRLKAVKLIAFHPGTTDSPLSKPFQENVPEGKLFTPDFVALQLYQIMERAQADGQASYLDWQGESITW
jgi:NAD(P)-dependent dehydrogenase (short-subunit alcohol dehydrogenase family)